MYQRGFTLIEVVIYIGLFAFIMTGALISVYSVFSTASHNQAKVLVQEEGSFILGKIEWTSSSISSANVSPDGLTLSVIKVDPTFGNPIVINISGGTASITRGSNPSQTLSNSNVSISCPVGGCFTHTLSGGTGINPESVSAKFTALSRTSEGVPFSQDFSTIKYLRK